MSTVLFVYAKYTYRIFISTCIERLIYIVYMIESLPDLYHYVLLNPALTFHNQAVYENSF